MRTPRDRSKFRKVHVRPETSECPACGEEIRFLWNGKRFVSFVGSRLHIDYHIYTCVKSSCPLRGRHFRPEFLTTRVLPKREFGLDVIALIGYYRIKGCLSFPKITAALADLHGVEISEREVEDLFNLYVALTTTDVRTDPGLAAKLKGQGGIVLTIDAAKPEPGFLTTSRRWREIHLSHNELWLRLRGGASAPCYGQCLAACDATPHVVSGSEGLSGPGVRNAGESSGDALWLMRDHISGEVLLGFVARNIDVGTLAGCIREMASLGIPITGVVSDGEPVIVDAVELALPGKPHQLCQYHFLANFAREATSLDSKLKKGLADNLRGLSLFENAAKATPSNRPMETDIRGPASLALDAEPPKRSRSKKGGAGAGTRSSCSRRAAKKRSSFATSAK